MTTDPPDPYLGFTLAGAALGLTSLAAVTGIAQLLAVTVSVTLGVVVGVLLATGIIAALAPRRLALGVVTGIFGMVLAGLAGFGMADYLRLASGRGVAGISVREAPRHARAVRFAFVDGRPEAELIGQYTRSGYRSGPVSTVAAPVTPDGWHRGEPVTLWACARGDRPPDAWRRPLRRAVALESVLEDDCRTAVRRAERAHRLRSAPGAPRVDWADPAHALAERRTFALVAPGVVLGLYLVALLIGGLAVRRRRAAVRR